jgi:hypothetical protein
MSHGRITKAVIACVENNEINTEKFFADNPYTPELEKGLYELRRKGFLTLDEGENRILEIAATPKLIDFIKANR